MPNNLKNLQAELQAKLGELTESEQLKQLKVDFLGKKGPIAEAMKKMRELSDDAKKELAKVANETRDILTKMFEEAEESIKERELAKQFDAEKIDVSLVSAERVGFGHPLMEMIEEVSNIFRTMGFEVVDGPEIETDYYNFEALNLGKDHPARDMQDSFYINPELLLRTHTSNGQIRGMEARHGAESVRVLSPGRVYRRDDDDATHSHQFMQIEGILIDKDISLAHLKGTFDVVLKALFGEEREIRLRPSYFPFTEPSVEVDVSCAKCGGSGCNICKQTGWIEVLGSGLVHPDVLRAGGFDPEVYTGYAFGMGVERLVMLKYGVEDIRNFYLNDVRFLQQFNKEVK